MMNLEYPGNAQLVSLKLVETLNADALDPEIFYDLLNYDFEFESDLV
jgi:hypothetical protein